MTVKELIAFLQDYDDDCIVSMVTCPNDNPLTDDLPVSKAVAIESWNDDTYIVLFPG